MDATVNRQKYVGHSVAAQCRSPNKIFTNYKGENCNFALKKTGQYTLIKWSKLSSVERHITIIYILIWYAEKDEHCFNGILHKNMNLQFNLEKTLDKFVLGIFYKITSLSSSKVSRAQKIKKDRRIIKDERRLRRHSKEN